MAEDHPLISTSLWALSIRQTDSYPFSPPCRMLATRVMPTHRNGNHRWSLAQSDQCREPIVVLFFNFPARIAEKQNLLPDIVQIRAPGPLT